VRRTVLITTFGSLGDINPYVAIALELKERGYSPIIGTSGFYRDMVEKAGIGFRPIRPDVNPEDYSLLERVMHPENGPEILIFHGFPQSLHPFRSFRHTTCPYFPVSRF
jgi:hypothetical protein